MNAPEPTPTRPVPALALASTISFAAIYDANFRFVWRSVRRLGVPESAVADVTQDVFLVVHRRLPEFDDRGGPRSWLYSITVRTVRAYRRTLAKKHPHALRAEAGGPDPDTVGDSGTPGPHELLAKREASRVLSDFLESLDDDKREVFVLSALEQLSAPEIAAALDVKLNTVYSRLRLARAEFSTALARHRARATRRLP